MVNMFLSPSFEKFEGFDADLERGKPKLGDCGLLADEDSSSDSSRGRAMGDANGFKQLWTV